jgi:hypothetical protein
MADEIPTFTDLTTIPTQQEILDQEVLPEAAASEVSITSWILNGPYRSLAMAVAFIRRNTRIALAALTCALFEDYAFGRATPPGGLDVTSWADLVAKNRYGLVRRPASYTKRRITLTNVSTTAYANVQPGRIILRFPSGNQWVLDEVITLAAAVAGVPSVTQALFRSYEALADGLTYQLDPSGAAISLVTANFSGVTATNPAPTYSDVSQAGSGLGQVVLTGTPGGPHTVAVKITSSGNATGDTVGWSTSVDGGAFTPQSGHAVTIDGMTLTLSDNGGNPAFVIDTVYYFQAPGTDITQNGAAQETPQALGQRAAGLWPLLAWTKDQFGNFVPPASPTQAAYIALALSANDNVVIAFSTVDPTINGLVRLYVAGSGGGQLNPSVLANEQVFFETFNMITDDVIVLSPAQRTVTLGMTGGNIVLKNSLATSAKQTMQNRLAAYLGSVDPGADLGINGRIDYDYVLSLIRTTPGVVRITGTLTINAGTADIQLPVTPGAYEVARWTQVVATSLPFSTV